MAGRRAGRPGFADDYALMASACLTLYETTFELRWFEEAVTLADELLRLFRDDERGGFFQTGSDAEELVVRPKDLYDNATPSGNSVAADVLLRLALFTGDAGTSDAAVSALRLIRDAMAEAPTGFGHALCALDLLRRAVERGRDRRRPVGGRDARARGGGHGAAYRPNVVLAVAAPGDERAARWSRCSGTGRERRTAHRLRLRAVHVQAARDRPRGASRSSTLNAG